VTVHSLRVTALTTARSEVRVPSRFLRKYTKRTAARVLPFEAFGASFRVGVPITPEKKQRTWSETLARPRSTFSKPVSSGSIRENAFENDYRKSRGREIAWFLPKSLGLLDNDRFQERPALEDRCFCLRCYRMPLISNTMPGMPSRLLVYNHDQARQYETGVICEGPSDVAGGVLLAGLRNGPPTSPRFWAGAGASTGSSPEARAACLHS
jgi:hypothetical protein